MAKKKDVQTKPLTEAEKVQAKKEAFTRVVPQRVNNAIKAIRLVKQCGSANYLSTDEQKRAVTTAIMNEVKELEAALAGNAPSTGGFKLPS